MNQATRLLSEVMDIDIKPAEDWWGEMPLSLVKAVLESPDVYQTLSLLGLDEEAKKYEDSRPIGEAVVEVVSNIDQAAQDRADNT
jgi:hypothetical protein